MKKILTLLFFVLCSVSILRGQKLFHKIENTQTTSGCDNCVTLSLDHSYSDFIFNNKPEEVIVKLEIESDLKTLKLKRNQIISEDFKVTRSSGKPSPDLKSVYYLHKTDTSLFTFSFFKDEVYSLINIKDKNYSIFKKDKSYIMSPDQTDNPFICNAVYKNTPYSINQIRPTNRTTSVNKCIKVGFEIDNDIFKDKGSISKTVYYVTSLFNEVYSIYQVDGINIKLGELYIWDTESPYKDQNSYRMLVNFKDSRKVKGGDVFQLLSYKSSGGIAYLNTLCSSRGLNISFASIRSTYKEFPNYSWSVMVIAHEIGHTLGSRHTHDCVWNGDKTAIDSCPGYTSGDCDEIGVPSDGGTVMSYCHLNSVGMNMSKGFHEQPANVIKNNILSSPCSSNCGRDDDDKGDEDNGPDSCKDHTLEIILDNFGSEVAWSLENKDTEKVVLSGGPYKNKTGGTIITKNICLEPGCYKVYIQDSYGDGLCCDYGPGKFTLYEKDSVLFESSKFRFSDDYDFCVELDSDDDDGSKCPPVSFSDFPPVSYGGVQDKGNVYVVNDNTIKLTGNSWKAINIDYNVNSNTRIDFEFKSESEGEIHGIALDTDNFIGSRTTFKVYGTQRWGIDQYDNYNQSEGWKKYSINIPIHLRGDYTKLAFINDKDIGTKNNESFFRNVRVYQGNDCISLNRTEYPKDNNFIKGVLVYPNPSSDIVNFDFSNYRYFDSSDLNMLSIYSLSGELLFKRVVNSTRLKISLGDYSSGVYIFKVEFGSNIYTGSFLVNKK